MRGSLALAVSIARAHCFNIDLRRSPCAFQFNTTNGVSIPWAP